MNAQQLDKPIHHRAFWAILLAVFMSAAAALSTDEDQPIQVEADTAELDDLNNKSVYTGNVILTQGSIRMTGDKMTVYNTEDDELDTLIMEGQPATYRQLPDESEVYDEAEAETIEYYELQNLVILIEKAEVRQEGLQMNGDRIVYDTQLSRVRAESGNGNTSGREQQGGQGRVKVILKSKKETSTEPGDNQ